MMDSVIDLDKDIKYSESFEKFEINKVTCPKCKNSFTFELPLLVCSKKCKFAAYVNSSPYPEKEFTSKEIPVWLISGYKSYRKCLYYAEIVEKFRIFRDGLDDKIIEYLKLCKFPDTDALPFDEINLLYSHNDNINLYFDKIDFNNNIINTYAVSKSIMEDIKSRIVFTENKNIWQMINRLTIKDYILKGGYI